jgi:hypothetical protein
MSGDVRTRSEKENPMRHLAAIVVALLAAAWVLSLPFPAATGGWGFGRFVNGAPANEKEHGTCRPCHEANVKGNDFVFTRYAR